MNYFMKLLALMSVSLLCASQIVAQSNAAATQKQGIILNDVPQKVDTKARYLFYISGYIVHAGDIRPTSPRFGVYEYEQILEALKQRNFVVISEARKQTAEIEPYAAKVAEQVRQLLKAGVPPQNITLVGASQGGWIAMLASTYLKNRDLTYVVIGACGADDGFLNLIDLHGNMLFIAEKTDRFPISSCRRFRADATGLNDYKEFVTNTGEMHGFLYRPMKEWIEPTIEWAVKSLSKAGLDKSLEQELMRFQRAVDEAETKKDFAALDRLLADGYIFTAPGGAISDKKRLVEDLKKAEAEAGQTIDYDDIKVYDYGNTAVVNYLMTVKGKDKDGKDYTNRYRNTVTWIKQQNSWRMAAIHVSRMRT